MKYLLIALFIIMAGCGGHEIQPTIVYKSHRTAMGNKMPDGICRYGYKTKSNGTMTEFDDSCSKYELFDIITSKK